MDVSRPDFMGLGLISVWYLQGLVSVSRFGLGLARDFTQLRPRDLQQQQMKIEAWKKRRKKNLLKNARLGSRSQILKVSVSDDEVSVSDSETETPSLLHAYLSR